ncbi:hypothetical protein Hdeb2414_s0004g00125611 [Helianthus debilis subsp. tardiflorus]
MEICIHLQRIPLISQFNLMTLLLSDYEVTILRRSRFLATAELTPV